MFAAEPRRRMLSRTVFALLILINRTRMAVYICDAALPTTKTSGNGAVYSTVRPSIHLVERRKALLGLDLYDRRTRLESIQCDLDDPAASRNAVLRKW